MNDRSRARTLVSAGCRVFLLPVFLILLAAGVSAQGKGNSIVIRDNTAAANGGENATSALRGEITAALQRERPCVETMDDQDIRDAIQDERERATFEGGDSQEALTAIANRLGASYVMGVKAMPGPGGTVLYSVFVMDPATARTVAQGMGSDPKQVADNIVGQLAPYLSNNCKPHWSGTIRYTYSLNETKNSTDGGPAHSTWRNVRRDSAQTSVINTMIKASLLPPDPGEGINSPNARVMHRTQFNFEKKETIGGETRCREPGKNPYFTNFNQQYSEITTQLGQGTDTMPVFISIDSDGTYTIKVNAPGGTTLGKVQTKRSYSGCPSEKKEPTDDVVSMPDGTFTGTSFEAEGKVDPKNKDVLAGTMTTPDGKTKIIWNLRLVKPKGK